MRRGLLAIGGDAGGFTGFDMLAGSIFVCGEVGRNPGLNLSRGSLVVGRLAAGVPAGFSPAGPGDLGWIRIYYRALRQSGFALDMGWLAQPWARFSGDRLAAGKGELYVHEFIE